jgi:hypothetical protein
VFSRRKREDKEASEAFERLRQQLISATPATFGIAPSERFPTVWASVMELGMAGAIASIVCASDGTTSMYTSTGGGMIGAGQHAAVVEANHRFLDAAERSLALLQPVDVLPLPEQESVRFNVLTFDGPRTAVGVPERLATGGLPLSPLFLAGNDVITQLRMV